MNPTAINHLLYGDFDPEATEKNDYNNKFRGFVALAEVCTLCSFTGFLSRFT